MEFLRVKRADELDAEVADEPRDVAGGAAVQEFEDFWVFEQGTCKDGGQRAGDIALQDVYDVSADVLGAEQTQLDQASVPIVGLMVLVFKVNCDDIHSFKVPRDLVQLCFCLDEHVRIALIRTKLRKIVLFSTPA